MVIVGDFSINKKYNIPFKFIGTGKPSEDVKKQKKGVKDVGQSLYQSIFTNNDSSVSLPMLNNRQSNDYLKQSRKERVAKKKELQLGKKMSALDDKAKEIMPKFTQKSAADTHNDDFLQKDVKFLFSENMDGLESPRNEIPKKVDSLYVSKPFGKYEPMEKHAGFDFNPDPNLRPKALPFKPWSHSIVRDVNQVLDCEQMKRINAGPKMIEFGKVFK